MNRTVLDSRQLIAFWRRRQTDAGGGAPDAATAAGWASDLERATGTASILSVTYLEFVGGAGSGAELRAYRAFLGGLEIVDGWEVRPSDFEQARRLAERVPRDRRPRGAMDCLIRALASRLGYAVRTGDRGFPGH